MSGRVVPSGAAEGRISRIQYDFEPLVDRRLLVSNKWNVLDKDESLYHIDANHQLCKDFFAEHLPQIRVTPLEQAMNRIF